MDICGVNGLSCIKCQPVCGSRKEVDIINKDSDIETFKKLFNTVGCDYSVCTWKNQLNVISVSKKYLENDAVDIFFDLNGKFKSFSVVRQD